MTDILVAVAVFLTLGSNLALLALVAGIVLWVPFEFVRIWRAEAQTIRNLRRDVGRLEQEAKNEN